MVERPAATTADLSDLTVTALGEEGDSLWTRRYSYRPVPIDPRQADSAIAAAGATFRSRGADSLAVDRALRDALDLPAHLPPVTRVLRSADGEIWLRREQDLREEWRWTVLDADGRPAREVRAPRRLALHVLETARVWGVLTDDYDVPWVVRYRLRRE